MSFTHFNREERIRLAALKQAGLSNIAIARELQRDVTTIGRELNRNRSPEIGRYLPGRAQQLCAERRNDANQQFHKIIPDSELEKYVVAKLKKYWSPQQITGRTKRKKLFKTTIVHETVYQYIYHDNPALKKYLRCTKGKYRRRYGTKIREKQREEAKKKRIDERPKIVETRQRIGDWEGDTIVGGEKTIHILTHADRKSGFLLADKASDVTAPAIRQLTVARFNKLPKKKRQTITYDNGVQFAEHEATERDLNVPIYFAYPYHSWERGTNENTNGLLRQFFPKKSAFKFVTQQRLDRIVKLINTRPRKRHNYATPEEVFRGVAV
ncbi:MAG: IS30 family transposase [Patescibacteria group bacterium]